MEGCEAHEEGGAVPAYLVDGVEADGYCGNGGGDDALEGGLGLLVGWEVRGGLDRGW